MKKAPSGALCFSEWRGFEVVPIDRRGYLHTLDDVAVMRGRFIPLPANDLAEVVEDTVPNARLAHVTPG